MLMWIFAFILRNTGRSIHDVAFTEKVETNGFFYGAYILVINLNQ